MEVPGGSTRTNGRSCSYSDPIRKGKFDTSSTLEKNFGTLMDQLFRNFFLNVPQWVDLKLWNHWYPTHNLIPSPRVEIPRFWGIFVILRTIFRSRSSLQTDVAYRVPQTFTENPVRGWRIHQFGAWLWTGFTYVTRDTRGRYLICVFFPICKKKWKKVSLKPSGTWTTRSSSSLRSSVYKWCWDRFNDTLRDLN